MPSGFLPKVRFGTCERLKRVTPVADALHVAMTQPDHPIPVLVVDPDLSWVSALRESEAALRIEAFSDAEQAQGQLGEHDFEAVVMSLDLDEDAAANLVAEIESRHPGLPLIAVASRLDDEGVAAACHLGAAGVLVRPITVSALLNVLHLPMPDAGFTGSCTGVPTAQLLTLHCSTGADGILHLRCEGTANREERIGSIYLEAGQPVHATTGDLVGSEAVHAMLSWVDAEATWIPGQARPARTIVGRWEGLLARSGGGRRNDDSEAIERMVAVAYPEVIEKLSRLAQTPDVLGAFLLRHAEIVAGRCAPEVDEQLASRALCRLAHVFFDVEAQPSEEAGPEIQAIVGSMRLVLDRIGPSSAGFQVGVFVRQAAPVCKSLRRLLRQIDGAFTRALKARARRGGSSGDILAMHMRVA